MQYLWSQLLHLLRRQLAILIKQCAIIPSKPKQQVYTLYESVRVPAFRVRNSRQTYNVRKLSRDECVCVSLTSFSMFVAVAAFFFILLSVAFVFFFFIVRLIVCL